MLEIFARDEGNAIPISAVSEATLPGWLEAHPKSRQWIAAIGFKGEPGTFTFIPDSGGRPSGVLASPADGASVWAYSGLSMALPEGTYALEIEDRDAKLTDMALGWALGSYAFTRYKKPQRSPATLSLGRANVPSRLLSIQSASRFGRPGLAACSRTN